MNAEQIDEVFATLDLGHLQGVAQQGPTPVFATISGAHLYGFALPDSDVDLRGAFLLPAAALRVASTPPPSPAPQASSWPVARPRRSWPWRP